MRTVIGSLLVFLYLGVSFAEVSRSAPAMGMGYARSTFGTASEAALLNPAALGADRGPSGGFLFPLLGGFGTGYWSDQLALTPYVDWFQSETWEEEGKWKDLVNHSFTTSFGLAGKSPEDVSERISHRVRNGVGVYAGLHTTLLSLAVGPVAVDLTTRIDEQMRLPAAPFLIVFSEDQGLLAGNSLDMTDLSNRMTVVTDITANYGQPFTFPLVGEWLNTVTRGFTDFQAGAIGGGVVVSLGHGCALVQTPKGSIEVSEDGKSFGFEAEAEMLSSGTGLHGPWEFANPLEHGLISGFGLGVNAGAMLYGERAVLSASLRRLGAVRWGGARRAVFKIRAQDQDIVQMINHGDAMFEPENGGYISDADDSLEEVGGFVTAMPAALNLGAGYTFRPAGKRGEALRAVADYVHCSAEYEQALAPGAGRSFMPRLSLGAENGLLWGHCPLRTGFIFGGAEKLASTAGIAIGTKWAALHVSYKALGHMLWFPRRGFELSFGVQSAWGHNRDGDGDGLKGLKDKCPDEAEDKDGFQDEDGCPDPDNDGDGIVDQSDSCSNVSEDQDGFEDEDGCPDWDNDADGIADTVDSCIDEAEDRDGFEDEDGCADPDNDGDGVLDSVDACVNQPEDADGVEDDDGCPEEDVDQDKVPDSLDRCPDEAEVMNFLDDEDGCPDTLAPPDSADMASIRNAAAGLAFQAGTERLRANTRANLPLIQGVLLSNSRHRFAIGVWSEAKPDTAVAKALSYRRAVAVIDSLGGLEADTARLVPVGFGPREGIGPRGIVGIRLIETPAEFTDLRTAADAAVKPEPRETASPQEKE